MPRITKILWPYQGPASGAPPAPASPVYPIPLISREKLAHLLQGRLRISASVTLAGLLLKMDSNLQTDPAILLKPLSEQRASEILHQAQRRLSQPEGVSSAHHNHLTHIALALAETHPSLADQVAHILIAEAKKTKNDTTIPPIPLDQVTRLAPSSTLAILDTLFTILEETTDEYKLKRYIIQLGNILYMQLHDIPPDIVEKTIQLIETHPEAEWILWHIKARGHDEIRALLPEHYRDHPRTPLARPREAILAGLRHEDDGEIFHTLLQNMRASALNEDRKKLLESLAGSGEDPSRLGVFLDGYLVTQLLDFRDRYPDNFKVTIFGNALHFLTEFPGFSAEKLDPEFVSTLSELLDTLPDSDMAKNICAVHFPDSDNPFLHLLHRNLNIFFDRIEKALGDRVRLHVNGYYFFPSHRFMEAAALALYGEDVYAGIKLAEGEVSREMMLEAETKNTFIVGVPFQDTPWKDLPETPVIPAFYFYLHEFYHLFDKLLLGYKQRVGAQILYRIVNSLPEELQTLAAIEWLKTDLIDVEALYKKDPTGFAHRIWQGVYCTYYYAPGDSSISETQRFQTSQKMLKSYHPPKITDSINREKELRYLSRERLNQYNKITEELLKRLEALESGQDNEVVMAFYNLVQEQANEIKKALVPENPQVDLSNLITIALQTVNVSRDNINNTASTADRINALLGTQFTEDDLAATDQLEALRNALDTGDVAIIASVLSQIGLATPITPNLETTLPKEDPANLATNALPTGAAQMLPTPS